MTKTQTRVERQNPGLKYQFRRENLGSLQSPLSQLLLYFSNAWNFILISLLSRPVRVIAVQNFAGFVSNNYETGHTP